jgi:hypothetical protein
MFHSRIGCDDLLFVVAHDFFVCFEDKLNVREIKWPLVVEMSSNHDVHMLRKSNFLVHDDSEIVYVSANTGDWTWDRRGEMLKACLRQLNVQTVLESTDRKKEVHVNGA